MGYYQWYLRKLTKYILFILLNLFLACTPWSSDTNRALDLAGENRKELEKVLIHYSNDAADSLKLKAAEYLISNMVFQYSIVGSEVDSINAHYKYVYGLKGEDRNKLFKSDSLRQRGDTKIKYDLQNVSSQFIINQIESAFLTYNYDWSKKYSFEMFCEYILPYKLSESDNFDWRSYANKKYFPMINFMSFERENIIYEAESFIETDSLIKKVAYNSSTVKIFHLYKKQKNKFKMTINNKNKGFKKVAIHYINGNTTATKARVKIDNKSIGNFVFPATGNWKEINDDSRLPIEFMINLDSGKHQLTIESLDKDLFLDFLFIQEYGSNDDVLPTISDGVYYLKNSSGWLATNNDSIFNGSALKVSNDFSKATAFEVTSDGFSYEFKIGQNSKIKVIDALQEKNSNSVFVFDNFNTTNQKWGLIPVKNGGFQIRNKATNKILSSEKSKALIQCLHDSIHGTWYFVKSKKKLSNGIRKNNSLVSAHNIDPAIKTAIKISDITNKFHWFGEANMGVVSYIIEFESNQTFKVWYDRVTFHFLTTEE
ncbi:hypothetical protein AR687_24270 [Flavobacteriaceae bacterium CRH]|nr:hypothetical protein AR687_24270 [Flavobacteriaceae bacterium CRH]